MASLTKYQQAIATTTTSGNSNVAVYVSHTATYSSLLAIAAVVCGHFLRVRHCQKSQVCR